MPRFFFNTRGETGGPDLIGRELHDLDCARDEAVRFAAEALQLEPGEFWATGRWSVEVCDDAGLILFVLTFAAAEMPFAMATPYSHRRGPAP